MPTAILIVYEYETTKLTGAVIDLYLMYKWCETLNYDIHVVTDITDEKITLNKDIISKAIKKQFCDNGIYVFFRQFRGTIALNTNNFSRSLDNIPKVSDNKLLMYYSGHGGNNCIKLPDGSKYTTHKLKQTILNKVNNDGEIFWIMDCCNPSGLNIPYKLSNNKFVLQNDQWHFTTQKIILFTSSTGHQKSFALPFGSRFTQQLLFLFHENITNIQHLCNTINKNLISQTNESKYKQTVTAYSSYVIDPIVWSWIYPNKKYHITSDPSLSMLILSHIINT